MKTQTCTKCGTFEVSSLFIINRNLGYCEICVEILNLGTNIESDDMEVNESEVEELETELI